MTNKEILKSMTQAEWFAYEGSIYTAADSDTKLLLMRSGQVSDTESRGNAAAIIQGITLWRDLMSKGVNPDAQKIMDIIGAATSLLEIGKRDMTNPKYDGYFDGLKSSLKATKL